MSVSHRELVTVQGVGNFRGLGGIPCNGKVVRKGLLFRSAGLAKITPKGVETLRLLGIVHVLDLRNPKEIAEKPDRELPFADSTGFDFTQGALPGVSREEVEKGSNLDFLKKAPTMEELYAFMMDENHVPEIARAVNFVVDSLLKGEPVLYHCSAGKDRTGILTCLILSILGVNKEDIFEDYLYTNRWAKKQARRYRIALMFRKPSLAKKTYELFIVKPSYLESVFTTIDSLYGGMEAFIKNVLGIDETTRGKLQEICLA